MQGTLRFWKSDKGYGFITPDDGNGSSDVFLHIKDLAGDEEPLIDDRVEFEIGEGRDGKRKAVEAKLL